MTYQDPPDRALTQAAAAYPDAQTRFGQKPPLRQASARQPSYTTDSKMRGLPVNYVGLVIMLCCYLSQDTATSPIIFPGLGAYDLVAIPCAAQPMAPVPDRGTTEHRGKRVRRGKLA